MHLLYWPNSGVISTVNTFTDLKNEIKILFFCPKKKVIFVRKKGWVLLKNLYYTYRYCNDRFKNCNTISVFSADVHTQMKHFNKKALLQK